MKTTLHYIADIPRADQSMRWRVNTEWQVGKRKGVSFFYFATVNNALAKYPTLRDQAITFHLEHALKELTTFVAPGADDPQSVSLIASRLSACLLWIQPEPYHCDQCGEFFRSKELHERSHQEAQ